MAWHSGTYKCGHDGRVQIYGKGDTREWQRERIFSDLCPDCKEVEKQQEIKKKNELSKKNAEERGLPKLTGSEKQVDWATTLRYELVIELDALIASEKEAMAELETVPKERKFNYDDFVRRYNFLLETKTDSRFWIDNRGKKPLVIVNEHTTIDSK